MNDKIKNAIDILTDAINKEMKADEALKYTQAALNLAHTAQVIVQTENSSKDNS